MSTQPTTALFTSTPVSLNTAIQEMLDYFAGNKWFVGSYWPENQHRVTRILTDLQRLVPGPARVFDPGCGNGYISYLAARLGYQIIATDSWFPTDRERLFQLSNVQCFPSNLNDLDPWPALANNCMDAALFGEVFEHLLNHPVGLMQQIHRVLKPGGKLILTTPNPSTLMNAVRVLVDRHSLWGTEDFASKPKIAGGEIIDEGDIHYREYRLTELMRLITMAGFRVDYGGYVSMGSCEAHSAPKRAARWLLSLTGFADSRLFAASDYVIATA